MCGVTDGKASKLVLGCVARASLSLPGVTGAQALGPSTVGPDNRASAAGKGRDRTTSHRTSDNAWVTTTPVARRVKRRVFELLRMEYARDMSDGIQARA